MFNLPAPPSTEEQQLAQQGKVLHGWTIPEFTKHERGISWYILFMGGGLALLIYAIVAANFLFAVMIILVSFILLTYHRRDPEQYQFAVREKGIQLGNRFVPYPEIDTFWIIYEPPKVKTLYLQRKSRWLPELSIPLLETNPIDVRETLADLVPEDVTKETESTNDTLARLMKIH